MDQQKNNEILLETGTNELEIVEFSIADEYYGINVAKVAEIIRGDIKIVPIPESHSSVPGVINLRGQIIPIINMAKHFHVDITYDPKNSRIIVSEFNGIKCGFWVSDVSRIHRLSWKEVETPEGLLKSKEGYAVGVIKIENKVLFLLDFERMAAIINPQSGIGAASEYTFSENPEVNRASKRILIAEDSAHISALLVDIIQKAGYQVHACKDGQEAWNTILSAANAPEFQKIDQYYNLVVSDIEMPQMDGLHLVKSIKDDPRLAVIPCIMFSSMINEQLALKCQSVGATDQITKPEIERLVELIDKHVL